MMIVKQRWAELVSGTCERNEAKQTDFPWKRINVAYFNKREAYDKLDERGAGLMSTLCFPAIPLANTRSDSSLPTQEVRDVLDEISP